MSSRENNLQRFGPGDKFCVDGMPLVLTSESLNVTPDKDRGRTGLNGTHYDTQTASFSRIIYYTDWTDNKLLGITYQGRPEEALWSHTGFHQNNDKQSLCNAYHVAAL